MRLTDVSYLLLHQRPFIPKTLLLESFLKEENYHREEAITNTRFTKIHH